MHEPPATLESLARDVQDLRNDVQGLVEAWETAAGLLKFVKWSAGLATALIALLVAVKALFHH